MLEGFPLDFQQFLHEPLIRARFTRVVSRDLRLSRNMRHRLAEAERLRHHHHAPIITRFVRAVVLLAGLGAQRLRDQGIAAADVP